MSNKPLLNANKANDFQTPPTAVKPLLPYLKTGWTIWECANGNGNITHFLKSQGYGVIATDIKDGTDFLISNASSGYDCIVTNPPYSLKDEFLKRCYLLGKPFALLLPLTTLEGKRQRWFYRSRGGLKIISFVCI